MLDIIELEVPAYLRAVAPAEDATAWRAEATLREFKGFRPIDFWFSYPVHIIDQALAETYPVGSREGNLSRSPKNSRPEDRASKLRAAFDELNAKPPVRVSDLAAKMGIHEKSARNWVKESPDQFKIENGFVTEN